MLAPRGGFVGRVAKCDDDDDWEECPPPDRSFLFELAISTGAMAIVAGVVELIKEHGRTKRERMRHARKSDRDTTIEGGE